jgi:hypothetical protein
MNEQEAKAFAIEQASKLETKIEIDAYLDGAQDMFEKMSGTFSSEKNLEDAAKEYALLAERENYELTSKN